MKKLLLTLLFLGFVASCGAMQMTMLTINNQTSIDWKVKIAAGGKWIKVVYNGQPTGEWITVPKKNSIKIDLDAQTFIAQLRSIPYFQVTVLASKDIKLRMDFNNVEGQASFTIKEDATKTVAQGKYYLAAEITVGPQQAQSKKQ